MTKRDFKKERKDLYSGSAKQPMLVDVPTFQFLMIDGAGHPDNSATFQDAMEAIYALAYTLKFMVKQADATHDYVVAPMEGLWSMADDRPFDQDAHDDWRWTIMLRQPEEITAELLDEAREKVRAKRNPAALDQVRMETFAEGRCVQMLHRGSYDQEEPTIQAMTRFAADQGYRLTGKHHEIYLSDPRRTAPEKLKTVLRHPVASA